MVSNPSTEELINSYELEEIINQFGSFLTLLSDKPISGVAYFVYLSENEELVSCISQLTGVSWHELVSYMAYRFPILNKSKKIKNESTLTKL